MSDEIVDPKELLEKKCKPSCKSFWQEYEACGKRIEGDTTGKHCSGYYFDFWQCVDKCASKNLFTKLK